MLYNGNTLHSISLGHAVDMNEKFENMKLFVDAIKYEEHKWQICGDLKVIGLHLSLIHI